MDQESRDANSFLVELDRGLKSQNIGEQSEAVVRFTNLFQKHQSPIIINSACLKLSEAYKCSSNFIRVQICEVLQLNQNHLNKIYNVDDFYRNIFTVTTSNDPIARSITLIALGNISPIVVEHKSIHHYISSSLESTIELELSATITCAASYVKQSSIFACNIYPKILSIIKNDKTSTEIKIKALSVLDHGFYNAHDAMIVREFLIDVITKSQLKKLICICLTLSTKIAYTSLTHIVPQIELLLKTFFEDQRPQVKLSAVTNLRFLAEKSPHIWQTEHVTPFINYLDSHLQNNDKIQENDQFLCLVLSIFCKLLTCKCNFISTEEKSRIFDKSYKLALNHSNNTLCSMAFELLTVMSEENSNKVDESDDLTTDIFNAIKSYLTNSMMCLSKSKKDNKNIQQVNMSTSSNKLIYEHIIKLCQLNPHFCPDLLKLVFSRISSKDVLLDDLHPFMTKLMCSILELNAELSVTPENCWKLLKGKSNEISDANFMNLCKFYFQISCLVPTYSIAEGLVDKVVHNRPLPFVFKVMRQAMRFGHFNVAGLICQELLDDVTSVNVNFYLESLAKICAAESMLSKCDTEFDDCLRSAVTIYEHSISPMRASIGNISTTDFHSQFLWLRLRTLAAHSNLRSYCEHYDAAPITYEDLLSFGNKPQNHVSDIQIQIPKISREFRNISDSYEKLSIASFDCDNNTLDYLYLLKTGCTIMADLIESIFFYEHNITVITKLLTSFTNGDRALEHRSLEESCIKLIELIKTEVRQNGLMPSEESIKPLIELIKTFSEELLSCPFMYPKYFFQPVPPQLALRAK